MTNFFLILLLCGAIFGDARCAEFKTMPTIFESLGGSEAGDESSGDDGHEDPDGYVMVGEARSRRKVSVSRLSYQHARERSSSVVEVEGLNPVDLLDGEPTRVPDHIVIEVLERHGAPSAPENEEDRRAAALQSRLDDIFEPRGDSSYVAILPASVELCNQLGICCVSACRRCCELMSCERIACQQRCNCDMQLVRALVCGESVKPAPLMM